MRLPFLALVLALPFAAQAQTHAVSGAEVLKITQQYVNAAPKRYIGSPGHAAAENFIKDHFAPEAAKGNLVADHFTASTPIGSLNMTNYIVKFPGKKDGIIVLAIFLIAAIICPTPDPIGMCLFATPMLALYFIGVLVAFLVHPNRRNRKKTA